MSTAINFLEASIAELKKYKSLGERTFQQLNDEEMHFQPNAMVNSIAVNIRHMHGNMQSRWTRFLQEDGEKSWRRRDEEFQEPDLNKEQLILLWDEGWATVFNTLSNLRKKDLRKTITIRNQPLTVAEAISRQLTHYAYHVGQIVMLGKWIRNENWESLSTLPGGDNYQLK